MLNNLKDILLIKYTPQDQTEKEVKAFLLNNPFQFYYQMDKNLVESFIKDTNFRQYNSFKHLTNLTDSETAFELLRGTKNFNDIMIYFKANVILMVREGNHKESAKLMMYCFTLLINMYEEFLITNKILDISKYPLLDKMKTVFPIYNEIFLAD